jgi:hypothetical protein
VAKELSHLDDGNLNFLAPKIFFANFPLPYPTIVAEIKGDLRQKEGIGRASAKDFELCQVSHDLSFLFVNLRCF